MEVGSRKVGAGIYQAPEQIEQEFSSLKCVSPEQLSRDSFFQRDKCLFLQVEGEKAQMHSHFYWLKKALRKKGQHLFAYRLRPQDFEGRDEILIKALNVGSVAELRGLDYILVN